MVSYVRCIKWPGGRLVFFLAFFLTFNMPLSAFSVDKLVVKDTVGIDKFRVTDQGEMFTIKGSLGEYATPARSSRSLNSIGNVGAMRLWRVHDSWPPLMEFIESKPSAPDTHTSYWDIFAGTQYTPGIFAVRDRLGGDKVHFAIFKGGNVGIGTGTSQANSKLTILGGYLQLATVTGTPPSADCSGSKDYGRMKVDPTGSGTLWVCSQLGWSAK